MAVYIVTGKLGAGKTLAAVSRIRHYLNRGLPVATNLDLYMEHFKDKWNRNVTCYRLPDKPKRVDMDQIGRGNESYDESKNGLVVLDECGTWLNARGWQDKDRQGLIEWMVHARKLGWDVIFIVQDISVLDKQAREMFAEHVTKQIFRQRDEGVTCYLTPWHLAGRYQTRRTVLDCLSDLGMFGLRVAVFVALHIVAMVTARSAGALARDAGLLKVGVPIQSRLSGDTVGPKTVRCPVVPLRAASPVPISETKGDGDSSPSSDSGELDASRYSIIN